MTLVGHRLIVHASRETGERTASRFTRKRSTEVAQKLTGDNAGKFYGLIK